MIQYEPQVLYQFAERLYAQARTVVLKWALLGAFIAGVSGTVVGVVASGVGKSPSRSSSSDDSGSGLPIFFGLMGAFLGGGLGAIIGQEKSFFLRLEAQKVLCQVKIQEATTWVAQNAPPR